MTAQVSNQLQCNSVSLLQLIAEVAYKGACYIAPTLGPNTCQLDDYNVHTLAE